MADTYSAVSVNALAEYQMQFAKIVKECYETTVLPVPLNAIEHLINYLAPVGKEPEEGKTVRRTTQAAGNPVVVCDPRPTVSLTEWLCRPQSLNWGRHYTWPASSLPFQLEMCVAIAAFFSGFSQFVWLFSR